MGATLCRNGAHTQRLRGVAARFSRTRFPRGHFDGIFANASLFHVPSSALPRVLRQLRAALKNGGVLFSSIPHGADQEGWSDGRYGVFHAPKAGERWIGGGLRRA